jgi:hypothetical protein
LEASQQFSFYRVGLLAPWPTPIPEDQASVFISPRGRVATQCCLHPTTHSTASQPRRPRFVMIVGAVAEFQIAYLPSTNCCHNFMRYIHSLSLINKCINSSNFL